MSALDDLFIEIEKHAVMRGHASLLLKVREEHSRMLSDLMKYEIRHEVDIREKDILREQSEKVQKLMDDVRKWGDATFGDRQTPDGIAAHLVKESIELHESIFNGRAADTLMELADCFILFLEVASHSHVDVDKLVGLARAKLEINKKRKWGAPDETGSIQHIAE